MSKKHLGLISLFFLLFTMGFVLIDLPEFKVPIGWPKPMYDFKKNKFSIYLKHFIVVFIFVY